MQILLLTSSLSVIDSIITPVEDIDVYANVLNGMKRNCILIATRKSILAGAQICWRNIVWVRLYWVS